MDGGNQMGEAVKNPNLIVRIRFINNSNPIVIILQYWNDPAQVLAAGEILLGQAVLRCEEVALPLLVTKDPCGKIERGHPNPRGVRIQHIRIQHRLQEAYEYINNMVVHLSVKGFQISQLD